MNLSELCIRRPVMTTLIMAGLIIFGVIAYRDLPVNELPNVDFPTISVSANLPGASPETMAAAVATPLEAQFATIPGLDQINSVSSQGTTQITLTFSLDRNIDAAAQDVQSAIAAAQRKLPTDMPAPPSFNKVNPSEQPILFLTLLSPTLEMSVLNDYAERQLSQRISTIQGVSQVNILGSQKYAVHIQMDPAKMAALGVGVDEVQHAIQQGNVNLPTGSLNGNSQSIAVNVEGQLKNAAAYQSLIVAYRNGAPVRIQDIGTAIDSVENQRLANWFNGKRSITIAVQRQPGSNTIKTIDAIKKILPGFIATLPASAELHMTYDRSVSIRESINDVQFTLVLAGILVVLVIFLFLRNVSATLIPSLALPISIFGTFGVMYALDYSLDNLSLLALTLAVGFVVDDAIVMLENIMRHIEDGMTPWEASLKGSKEIGFTIISMTISLIAVFIPLLFMAGIVGRLLHEFAATICAAILVSGFVSLTLTPMLCSRFVKPHKNEQHGRAFMLFERFFDALLNGYRRSLLLAMRHHFVIFIVFLGTVVLTGVLFSIISKDFIPNSDSGRLVIRTEGPQDASFVYMVRHQSMAWDALRKNPNIELFNSQIGGSQRTLNQGQFFLRLKDHDVRKATPEQVIQQLREELAKIPGMRFYIQNPATIQIGGQNTVAQYQYTLQDSDINELYDWADRVYERFTKIPGFQDVATTLNISSPSLVINLQRDKLATMGLSASQVEDALASAYSSLQVSTIYASTNQYQVILEVDPLQQQDASALSKLYVRSTSGTLVPLDTVATITRKAQSLTVNHIGQIPSVTISFNLPPGLSLGDAVKRIKALEAEMHYPVSLTGSMQGTAQAFQDSLVGLGLLLMIAILVIYILLGILYESFIHPLTILSGLPSAGVGALITLMIFGYALNLYSFVGIIMLIGIVKKNAIMMIDFALERQRNGNIVPSEAIVEACLIRFRPIMMTTMAALVGTLPIAIGLGAGGAVRAPLGLAVVGGLILSQILTLFITPVIYVYLDNFDQWLKRRKFASVDNRTMTS